MKIYTKTGDKGQTSLIGGTRVPKYHIRIEAYGTVDELNSHLGVIRDQVKEEDLRALLLIVQDRLFTIGSLLAADPDKSKMKLPELEDEDIERLEKEIDRMNEVLPEMRNFILPGGNLLASYVHVARCVCRRAERRVIELNEQHTVDEKIIRFLNRLSDHLFVLSRYISHLDGSEELPWHPKM